MAGYEVARIEAVITANASRFDTTLDKSEAKARRFSKNTDTALKAADRSSAALGTGMQRTGREMEKLGSRASRLGRQFTTAFGVSAVFGAAGLAAAVLRTGVTFDKTMSAVRATSGATAGEFNMLRKAAIEMGGSTVFSATDVAGSMVELGKAGMTAKQQMAALPGVLAAAAASGEDMAAVSTVMVDTLGGFRMAAGGATHVADGLARVANETSGNIGDLGEAMKYVAPVARGAAMSFDQTAAAMQIMAEGGVKGSMAGTNLRGVLLDMRAPTEKVSEQMKAMGLTFRDSSGKLAPFGTNIDRLKAALKRMPDAKADKFLRDLFGVQNMAAMEAFLGAGSKGFNKYTKEIQGANGEAKKMADIMNNNLAGDVEAITGAFGKAAIALSDQFRPQIRDAADDMQAWVKSDEFAAQADSVANTAMRVASAMADGAQFAYEHRTAIQALAVGYGTYRVAAMGATAAQMVMNASMMAGAGPKGAGGAAAGVGRLGVAMRAVGFNPYVLGIAAVAGGAYYMKQRIDEAAEADARWAAVNDRTVETINKRAAATKRLVDSQGRAVQGPVAPGGTRGPTPALVGADEFAATQSLADNQLKLAAATEAVSVAMARQQQVQDRYAPAVERTEAAIAELHRSYKSGDVSRREYTERGRELNDQLGEFKGNIDRAGDAVEKASNKVGDLEDKVDGANKALGNKTAAQQFMQTYTGAFTKVGVSAATARAKIQAIAGPVKMNVNVARQVLNDMTAAQRYASFGSDNTNAILKKMGYVNTSKQFGESFADAVDRTIAKGKAAPGAVNPSLAKIGAFTPSTSGFSAINAWIDRIQANAAAGASFSVTSTRSGGGGKPKGKAGGGRIRGRGTGTSDDIPAMLSNGEYVIRASSVSKYGDGFMDALNAGQVQGFAAGGKAKLKPSEVAVNRYQTQSAGPGLAYARLDARLASAEATPGKGDDLARYTALTTFWRSEVARIQTFMGSKSFRDMTRPDKQGVVADLASARRSMESTIDARGAIKQDARDSAAERARAARDARVDAAEKAKSAREKAATSALDAENLRREAMGLESVEGEKRRNEINAIRRANGLPALEPYSAGGGEAGSGGSADSDQSAIDARLRRDLEVAQSRAQIAEGSLAAFTSSGDLGFGGVGSAFAGAAGGRNGVAPAVVNNIYSLSGYDPAIQSALAATSNAGNASGGNADRLYSGRV